MDDIHHRAAAKLASHHEARQAVAVVAALTGGFFVCAAATGYLAAVGAPGGQSWKSALLYLPIGLLYLTTLGLVRVLAVRQAREVRRLSLDIERERAAIGSLRGDFEAAIEQRVFELQRVNGALNREIAERIQAKEEVVELQKQLRLILDSAGEGILGLDDQGRVVFVNTAASLMLGWDMGELVGKHHHELIHHTTGDGEVYADEDCPIQMAYRDGLVHFKTDDVFWTKTGQSFPVEYVSTPINDRGMLTGAVVVFRDTSTFA